MFRIQDDIFVYRADDWFEEFAERWPNEVGVPYYCLLRLELVTDMMQEQISSYLSECTKHELSYRSSKEAAAMIRLTNELESIGDSCLNLFLQIERIEENNFKFNDEMNKEIIGLCIHDLLWIIAAPRTDVFFYSLAKIGFKKYEINTIIQETYTADKVYSTVRSKSAVPLNLLKNVGVFNLPSVRDRFKDSGLLPNL